MIYRFAGFALDDERLELRSDGSVIPLAGKSLQLLLHLLRSPGRTVTRDELLASLWPNAPVSQAVIPVHVRSIRRALGEDPPQAIVRTIRGHGYSVVCRVERSENPGEPAAVEAGELPLLGRGALLDELRTRFQLARSGRGVGVVLHGEPGIGKTAVLEALVAWARQQDAGVLHVRGPARGGALPYATLSALLRRALVHAVPGETPAGSDPREQTRTRAKLRMLLRTAAREQAAGNAADRLSFRIAHTLLQSVRGLTASRPLVLAIDDLHAVDRESLEIFARVFPGLDAHPVFVLATLREIAPEAREPVAKLLGTLASHPFLDQRTLGGLCEQASAALVKQELGRSLPDAAIQRLHQRTGGNPRFLRLLLREGTGPSRSDAQLDPAGAPLPESVRAAVEQRLHPISPACRETLTWASVIGMGFSFSLLEQVSDCEAQDLLERLMEAATAHLIEPEHAERIDTVPAHGSYRFTHPLIRETLYDALSAPDRMRRHHAVGEALERFASSDPDTISALALHFYEASQAGRIEGATAWCLRAAHLALGRAQHDRAVAHLERAHALESGGEPDRACAIQLALGDAQRRAGQRRRALRSFLEAAHDARGLQRADLLALAVLGLGQLVRRRTAARAMFALDDTRLRQHRTDLLAMADEALAGLAAVQLGLRARVLALRSQLEASMGRRVPIAHVEEPLSLARRSSDPRALFDTLLSKRMSLQGPSNQERALAVSNELMDLGLSAGARPLIFTACELRIPLHLTAGDMDAADQDIALAERIARELESPRQELTVAQFRLGRRLGDGNADETRRLLKRVEDLAGDDDADVDLLHKGVLLWMTCAEGRGLMARSAVEQLRARQGDASTGMHALLAHYFWAVGDRRQATEHFDQAAQHDFTDIPYTDGWLWTLSTCADLASRLRDPRRARRLTSLIAPHARLNVINPVHCYRGSASHVLARLALVQGDLRGAREHFEIALDFNRKIGAIPSLLLTQYHFGRMLLKGGEADRRRGRELLSEVSSGASASAIPGLLRRSDLQNVSATRGG